MCRRLVLAVMTFIIFGLGALAFGDSESELSQRMKVLTKNPEALSPENFAMLRQFHIIFVGGFTNELLRGYFAENKKALNDMGIKTVSTVFPPSGKEVEANADALDKTLREKYREGGRKPIILVGHSKGGVETLLWAIRHPDLITDGKVASVVIMQSPVDGATMVDEVRNTVGDRVLNLFLPYHRGFVSMSAPELRAAVQENINTLTAHGREYISRRVFYVRSWVKTGETTIALKPTQIYLKNGHGPNDGLVLLKEQRIKDFGRDLGIVEANHVELIARSSYYSDGDPAEIRGFTQGLFETLLEYRTCRHLLQPRR